jgi:hypothetical protein
VQDVSFTFAQTKAELVKSCTVQDIFVLFFSLGSAEDEFGSMLVMTTAK